MELYRQAAAGLARGTVVSGAASAAIVELLAAQAFNEGIPAGLPPGIRVAHKTGSIARLYHDAGIVAPEGVAWYTLAVLAAGLDEEREAQALVAAIAGAVHAALAANPAHPR